MLSLERDIGRKHGAGAEVCDITAKNYYGYMDFRGNLILQPSEIDHYAVKNKDFFLPRSKIVNLKENTIKDKVYYDYKEGKFTELTEPKKVKSSEKEDREEKRLKGYNYISFYYEIKEGGSLVLEFNKYTNYINNNNLIKFDDNKKEVWRYKYNTSGDKKINEELTVLEKDENYIYALLQNNNKKEKTFQLLILDMKTGKEVHKKEITGLAKNTMDRINRMSSYSFGRISNDKTFDDKIVILGRNYEDTGYLSTGFSRLLIDRKTFAVDTKEIRYESLKPFIKNLTYKGFVEKGDMLINLAAMPIVEKGMVNTLRISEILD